VDLVLHPLKSELNFPMGPSLPLQLGQLRFTFPIYLLSPFTQFFTKKDNESSLLVEIHKRIRLGIDISAIQTSPHFILVQEEFYEYQLKGFIAKLAIEYLKKETKIIREIMYRMTQEGISGPELLLEEFISTKFSKPS